MKLRMCFLLVWRRLQGVCLARAGHRIAARRVLWSARDDRNAAATSFAAVAARAVTRPNGRTRARAIPDRRALAPRHCGRRLARARTSSAFRYRTARSERTREPRERRCRATRAFL